MDYAKLPPTVQEIGRINFEGNVIPHTWYREIVFENNKPDLVAIVILADLCYWYRPAADKDERTGTVAYRKRFRADLLQRDYGELAEQFGVSKLQAQRACYRLRDRGLIRITLRDVKTDRGTIPNVVFLEPVAAEILAISFKSAAEEKVVTTSDGAHFQMLIVGGQQAEGVSTSKWSPLSSRDVSTSKSGGLYSQVAHTEITTEITTERVAGTDAEVSALPASRLTVAPEIQTAAPPVGTRDWALRLINQTASEFYRWNRGAPLSGPAKEGVIDALLGHAEAGRVPTLEMLNLAHQRAERDYAVKAAQATRERRSTPARGVGWILGALTDVLNEVQALPAPAVTLPPDPEEQQRAEAMRRQVETLREIEAREAAARQTTPEEREARRRAERLRSLQSLPTDDALRMARAWGLGSEFAALTGQEAVA